MRQPLTLLISTGEASGDLHGGALMEAFRRLEPDAHLVGMGGTCMAQAGVELLIDIEHSSVMGITEVVRQIPEFLRKLARLREWMETHRPDALVLVDFPDFNLRLGNAARKLGIPVVYHIPPKAWAWRPKRGRKVARLADALVCFFPFEAAFYREQRAVVHEVGHPLVDIIRDARPLSFREARAHFHLPEDAPVLGLLPGSRRRELAFLLTPMLEAAEQVRMQLPDVQCVLPCAPTVTPAMLAEVATLPMDDRLRIIHHETYDAIRACDAVLAASGTVTLETAILGVPMVIVYRLTPLTYALVRRLVRVPFSGLPNLVAGREIAPELLQEAVTPERMAEAVLPLLRDTPERRKQQDELERVAASLGNGGALEQAAQVVRHVARHKATK
jgi:lipid-A-disaccharide synthase